jgi:predicted RNase H-like HicB family nuclease
MTVKIVYSVQIWREDKQYIAHAMPLDVASSGETAEAARQAVDEAVRLFLATAMERGTLEEVLEEAGYRRKNGSWEGPEWLGVEQRSCLAAA